MHSHAALRLAFAPATVMPRISTTSCAGKIRSRCIGLPISYISETATWSPGVFEADLALTATPEDTVTETGLVMDPSCSTRFIQAIRLRIPVGRAPSVQTFGL